MQQNQQTESPFRKERGVRFGFGTMLMLLLMVVAAGIGILLFYAVRVPAITSEFNAWLGRPDAIVDREAAHKAQLQFALFVYTAPLGLGLLVHTMHYAVNWLDRVSRSSAPHEDDDFRME